MQSPFEPSAFRNRIYFPVRFSDLDAMGHVNNARYLTFFEEGRADWFKECMGMAANSTAYPVIVARVEMDYLAPVPFGEQMGVYHRVAKMGAKSMEMEAWACMEREGLQIPAAKYKITLVWFDYESGKSMEIPAEARKRISEFEGLAF
jgi:acyl-CoA thioester hydrolase